MKFSFFLAFILQVFGLLMVYSSSYIYAREYFQSGHFFIYRQLLFTLIGILAFFMISRASFSFLKKFFYPSHLLVLILIILTFIFPHALKGSKRWIHFFGYSLQPGEFLKISSLLALDFLTEKKRHSFLWIVYFLPFILLLLQPDFGTFVLCLLSILYFLFLKYFSWQHLLLSFLSFITLISSLILIAPYRLKRFLSFLDPWQDPYHKGFQIIQSFLAFSKGGITGVGLGNGHEKLFYLPEAHNDFLFSVLGEELGFLGVFLFVTSYFIFFFLLYKDLSLKKNPYLGMSLVFVLFFQAFTNMAVCLGLLPTKGLTLPFFSYGGSSLLVSFSLLGIIYVISKEKT